MSNGQSMRHWIEKKMNFLAFRDTNDMSLWARVTQESGRKPNEQYADYLDRLQTACDETIPQNINVPENEMTMRKVVFFETREISDQLMRIKFLLHAEKTKKFLEMAATEEA